MVAAGMNPEELVVDPDDVPGGIIDQADAAPVTESVQRPPPLGVIPPGQQPGLDSTFTGFRSLAKAQAPILAEAITKLLHTEKDKCLRAAKKDGFPGFVDTFYRGHVSHVRDTIAPAIRVMVDSAWAVAKQTPTTEMRSKVQRTIEQLATSHVEASKADLSDLQSLPQRVAVWEEARVAPFVESVIEQLDGLLRK
jgi:hypothetical protein